MIRVLIADDHAIVRHGLQQILSLQPDLTVAGQAASGEELLAMVRQGRGEVVVLDLTLPGMAGLDVLRELRQLAPRLPVLILSVHAADQYVTRALRAGASGYLTKESAAEELVQAIRRVVAGGRYLNPATAERLADYVASTKDILAYAHKTDAEQFIIGTEVGILHRLRKENPDKRFFPASEEAVCHRMKLIRLETILWSLENMTHQVKLPDRVLKRARPAIMKMLDG